MAGNQKRPSSRRAFPRRHSMAKLTQPWFTTSSSTSNPRGLDKFLFSTIAHAGKRRVGGAYCSSSGIPPGFHGLSSAIFPLNLPCNYFVLPPTIACCTPSGTLNSALMDVPSHAEIFQTAFPSESVTHQVSCFQCLTSSWRSPAKVESSDHPISAGPANPSFLEIG